MNRSGLADLPGTPVTPERAAPVSSPFAKTAGMTEHSLIPGRQF
jgi:hypothetical protein